MNEGTILGRTRLNAAQRIVLKHAGQYTGGEWSRASGLTKDAATALAGELRTSNYQVRGIIGPEAHGKYEVIFR